MLQRNNANILFILLLYFYVWVPLKHELVKIFAHLLGSLKNIHVAKKQCKYSIHSWFSDNMREAHMTSFELFEILN